MPTEAWKNWGTAIALVLTVACIVPLYRGKYLGRLKMQTPLSSITRIGIGIIIPILVCVMFWVGVINGVGSIATSLIGKSKSTYAKFYKERGFKLLVQQLKLFSYCRILHKVFFHQATCADDDSTAVLQIRYPFWLAE